MREEELLRPWEKPMRKEQQSRKRYPVRVSMYIPYTTPRLGKRTADAVQAEFANCGARDR
jgi:hypothetical protein